MAGRYRLERQIGRGGMGEVWRAKDELLARPVAVKLLLAAYTDDVGTARFRREARAAARLSHPQVVAVYDFGTHENRLYLVMELLDGHSLENDLASPKSMSPRRIAAIGAQAAAGLAAAHAQGVVHRDIKPGNLMLASDGTVKIGDFGLAQVAEEATADLTRPGHVMGTVGYLSPERLVGQPGAPAGDVYALGCVLYALLAGHPPFSGDTAASVMYQHINTPPVPPRHLRPELPEAFEARLMRMLAKDPAERPTARETADWFGEPALGSLRGPATPPPPIAPATAAPAAPFPQPPEDVPGAPRPRRGRPGRTVIGAVSLVAAAIVGLSWLPDGTGTGDRPSREASQSPSTAAAPATTTAGAPSSTASTPAPLGPNAAGASPAATAAPSTASPGADSPASTAITPTTGAGAATETATATATATGTVTATTTTTTTTEATKTKKPKKEKKE